MAAKTSPARNAEFEGLDQALAAELPAFEQFFKTFGFKRVHGRVWGLLVLSGQPLSSRATGPIYARADSGLRGGASAEQGDRARIRAP